MLHPVMQRHSAKSLLGATVAEEVTDTVAVAPAEQENVTSLAIAAAADNQAKGATKGISQNTYAGLTTRCHTCSATEWRQGLIDWQEKASQPQQYALTQSRKLQA